MSEEIERLRAEVAALREDVNHNANRVVEVAEELAQARALLARCDRDGCLMELHAEVRAFLDPRRDDAHHDCKGFQCSVCYGAGHGF